MSTSPHLAVLIGPRAHALRDVLPEVLPALRCRVVADLYAFSEDGVLEESDSWWIDRAEIGAEEVGVLRFLRRMRPDALRVLLVGEGGETTDPHDAQVSQTLRSLGFHLLAAPPPLTRLRALLGSEEAAVREDDQNVIAGIADQIANPLAALAARLQLCEFALQSSAPVDFEDNLALARHTTQRIGDTLEKLRLLTARGPGTCGPQGALATVHRLLEPGGPLHREPAAKILVQPVTEGSDFTVWLDASFFEQALAAILRACLDLSADGIGIVAHDQASQTLIEVRFETPLPLPVPHEEIFTPFGLNKALRDPDLGLDLALGRALIRSSGGQVHGQAHAGFLEGIEIRLPSAGE